MRDFFLSAVQTVFSGFGRGVPPKWPEYSLFRTFLFTPPAPKKPRPKKRPNLVPAAKRQRDVQTSRPVALFRRKGGVKRPATSEIRPISATLGKKHTRRRAAKFDFSCFFERK